MRIDAHQHYWKISRGDYTWLSPHNNTLYRDFLPEHLKQDLDRNHIEKTILVQATPKLEETEYLLDLSNHTSSVAGVVGWLDLEGQYKNQYERFKKHSKFVGIRIMIQEMEDPLKVLNETYIESLKYFTRLNFPIDLLVTSEQLPILLELLKRVPDLRGVVDHLAKPNIASGCLIPWKKQMSEVAKLKNIYCKLSGLVTEANHKQWTKEEFVPYINHILNEFGTNRVMFGSDWPVCLLSANYDDVLSIVSEALGKLSAIELKKIFGNNAKSFYKL